MSRLDGEGGDGEGGDGEGGDGEVTAECVVMCVDGSGDASCGR